MSHPAFPAASRTNLPTIAARLHANRLIRRAFLLARRLLERLDMKVRWP
jgi:hypothetical protein